VQVFSHHLDAPPKVLVIDPFYDITLHQKASSPKNSNSNDNNENNDTCNNDAIIFVDELACSIRCIYRNSIRTLYKPTASGEPAGHNDNERKDDGSSIITREQWRPSSQIFGLTINDANGRLVWCSDNGMMLDSFDIHGKPITNGRN
jgi:hypothetical protein